jgi:hypothetical protein
VYRLLATATTTNLNCGHDTGGFVFDAFAVDSCTVSAAAKGDGKQANQG